MEFWSKFYRNEQKGPKGSLFSMVASYCRCWGAYKKRVKIPSRLRESHGRAKSSVLHLDLRPRLALGKKVGFFSKKWQGFALQKHYLGSNKPCEMIQYHFQKVFLVFLEFIYETGRRTRFCMEYLSKFRRNEQNALKGPLFSPVASYRQWCVGAKNRVNFATHPSPLEGPKAMCFYLWIWGPEQP